MRFAWTRSIAVIAAVLLLLAVPSAHANCGAEGCPLATHGPEAPLGQFTFDLGYQSVEQNQLWDGHAQSHGSEGVGHITEVLTRSRSWTASSGVQLTPRFGVRAYLPWSRRTHTHDLEHHAGYLVRSSWTYEGLGDASVLGTWRAFGRSHEGAGEWSLIGGAKLPTGKRHIDVAEGEEEPEPPVRLGTGSTDALVGASLLRRFAVASPIGRTSLPVSLSVMSRWNGTGTDGYRVGNEVHGALTVSYPLHARVLALAQANGVTHARDDIGDTDAEAQHTGGATFYATPGLRVLLPGGVSAYGYWQMRAYQRSNGPQLVAPAHLVVGANLQLGR